MTRLLDVITNIAIFRWDSPGGVTYEYPAGIQVIPQFVPIKQELHRYFGSTTEHFISGSWLDLGALSHSDHGSLPAVGCS